MNQKTKKRLLRVGGTLLAGSMVFALCSMFELEQSDNVFKGTYSLTAFADGVSENEIETDNQLNVTMSDIKYKMSTDNQYMLIVTAFEADEVFADTTGNYIIGYEVNGVDTFNDAGKKYYENIQLKTSETTSITYSAKEVFGSDYDGYWLNVYEIENYNAEQDYTLRSFIKKITLVGDTGYETEKVSYGALETKNNTMGTVSGQLSGADVDYSSFVITMYGENDTYMFTNVVNEDGEYSINARIGNYQLVVSSPEGYWGAVEAFDVLKAENVTKDITVAEGNVVGNVVVNGNTVKMFADMTEGLINDFQDNVVRLSGSAKYPSSFGGRNMFIAPLATQVESGEFAYTATMTSTVFYGYAGIGITDGTSFLLMQTTYSPSYYNGGTTLQFGKFNENGWSIGFTTLIQDCGGVEKQSAQDFLAKPAFVRVGDELKLYMGNIHVATLTKDGLTMPKNYMITANFSILKENYATELANFMNANTEYGFLYCSTEIAGWMDYSSQFASVANGKVVFPAGVSANMQDTRLVVKDMSTNTYATYTNIFDANGNYSLNLAAGEYEFLFSNPTSLTKTVSVNLMNGSVDMGEVVLEQKNLVSKPLVINNADIKVGANIGEYTDVISMPLSSNTYIFNNTVYQGEAIFKGAFKGSNTYNIAGGVGITDGSNALRVVMTNGDINAITFEYLTITPDKTGIYVSNFRSYRITGSGLPFFNYGKTALTNGGAAVDMNFSFHKKVDGSIDVYYEQLLLITVKSDGFYLIASGLTATTQNGKLYNATAPSNAPDASFVAPNREYAVMAATAGTGAGAEFTASASVETVHATQTNEKAEALKTVLNGKYLSILGDSISTYHGVSDVHTNNDTLVIPSTGDTRRPFYPYNNVSTQSVPYWGQLANATGMNVLVNNSISGSNVVGCGDRAVNLHANTGALAGTNPDVILVYFGINDVGATLIDAGQFEAAYREMIDKMVAQYPNADIFVMDLPFPNSVHVEEKLNQFNTIIHEIVEESEGVELIQMRGSKADNAVSLTCDGLHPNAVGMNAYYEVICDALYNYYCI